MKKIRENVDKTGQTPDVSRNERGCMESIQFLYQGRYDAGREGPSSGGEEKKMITVPRGITWEEALKREEEKQEKARGDTLSPLMGLLADGRVRALGDAVTTCRQVEAVRLCDAEGQRIYTRSLIFLYTLCASRYAGEGRRVLILHSVGGNLYSEIRRGRTPVILSTDEIEEIEADMRRMMEKNLPIERKQAMADEEIPRLKHEGRMDQLNLLHYQIDPIRMVYELDGQKDYYDGSILPSTGFIRWFDLIPYKEGIIIRMPALAVPHTLRRYKPQPHLFSVFTQTREWGEVAGVENIGDLNNQIAEGHASRLIAVAEALQSKHLSQIADKIASGGSPKKLVLIAGPSSSGKTTFAQKLGVQLMAEGLRPHLISMDNYFINRADMPKEPDGSLNFEDLSAVDTALFNQHMQQLLRGQEIQLPTYNFLKGEREYNGDTLRLGASDILLVEGIHGLNEKVSELVPAESKFKIFISAITTLNIDDHNRIPTSDIRLLRRIIRDYQHRGYTAAMTISKWPSVRAGEERNIFPFQEEADIFFNSGLIYELAVIKSFAKPLLYAVRRNEPEFFEARRLIRVLDYFLGVSSEQVPAGSLIREFIGGGIYHQ